MIGLLRTLLIILLVYYGVRILYRLFSPLLMRYAAKKVQQQFNENYRQYPHQNNKKEGEITIEKQPSGKPKTGEKVGEYIDFEEID